MHFKLPRAVFCPCPSTDAPDDFLSVVDSQILGVARIVIQSADLHPSHLSLLPLNPFVKVTTDACEHSFYTGRCSHTSHPNWLKYTLHVPVSTTDSGLRFAIRSKSRYWKTTSIGSAFLPLDRVLELDDHNDITLPVTSSQGLDRGHILISMIFNAVQSSSFPSDVGIVRVLLYEAKALESASRRLKTPSPRAQVRWIGDTDEDQDATVMFTTPIAHNTENPTWNSCYDFVCANRHSTTLIVHILDCKVKDADVGHMRIPLRDLLDASEGDSMWWPLSGSSKGELKMRAEWKAIAMSMK